MGVDGSDQAVVAVDGGQYRGGVEEGEVSGVVLDQILLIEIYDLIQRVFESANRPFLQNRHSVFLRKAPPMFR